MKRKVISCAHLVGCTACGGASEFGIWVRAGGHSAALCETCARVVANWHAKNVQAKRIRATSKKLRAKKRRAVEKKT
jgi:hypothetical protein